MSIFFITATGTDAGKTLITAALCHQLRAAGKAVNALKPVVSGFGPDTSDSDPMILLRALGRDVTQEAIAAISPWRFAAPLSPGYSGSTGGPVYFPGCSGRCMSQRASKRAIIADRRSRRSYVSDCRWSYQFGSDSSA